MLKNELILTTIVCIIIFRCRVFVIAKKPNFGIALKQSHPPKKSFENEIGGKGEHEPRSVSRSPLGAELCVSLTPGQ